MTPPQGTTRNLLGLLCVLVLALTLTHILDSYLSWQELKSKGEVEVPTEVEKRPRYILI